MTSWWAAYAAALHVPPLPPRWLPLDDALGTTLAGPLMALATTPGVDVSAMDGYAVRGDPPWRLRGRSLAGDPMPPALGNGDAWEIATGAAVPSRSVGVLPYESASLSDGLVSGDVDLARHVRRRGEQCSAGDVLLPKGTTVSPLVLGLAAQAGVDGVLTQARPRVVLLVSGDELTTSGVPQPGHTRDALGPMLPGLITGFGADLIERRTLSDDPRAMAGAFGQPGADVLVVTGASSRGPADHLRPSLAAAGARLLVDGVRCRPGHPMLLAQLPDGRYVVGLPGNPLAAVAAAVTLVQPLVSALAGVEPPALLATRAMVDFRGNVDDVSLVPVTGDGNGVAPTKYLGAAQLRGVAMADGLAVVPAGGALTGDRLDTVALRPQAAAAWAVT